MAAEADKWMLVGRVTGVHGVRGELKVQPLTDFPERFTSPLSVFLRDEKRRYTIVSSRFTSHILVRLEGVSTRNEADALRGQEIWIPRNEAVPLEEGEFYADEIIGLRAETESGEDLGIIDDILVTGANDVYIVRSGEREILVPAIHEVVREIDVDAGRVVISPLPGMIP